ncbi:MAG: 2,3-bisphosphoglycerate-independent phosphoglycerate mutase [Xanthomonadales bacterium]|nr:2,3-bisphosphoglycerate-independent phosphoglycerate mutase [Xanthomonadales bacterium]
MKTIVVNKRENEKTPFLRGILTRSLLDAGLAFEDAFAIATKIRDEIANTKKITTEKLQEKVADQLRNRGEFEVLEQYIVPSVSPPKILVTSLNDVESAFSRGQHTRYLQSAGLKMEKAEYTTEQVYAQLIADGISSISTFELGYLTYLCLQQEVGDNAAKRYLVWSEFQDSKRPLMLLIGGTVAAGKSTIATEMAHLLEIVRIQSTDMLREVMRVMIPERLLPVLHCSSFDAWKTLPIQDKPNREWDHLVAEGYKSQAELLAVPCEAVLQRAVEEGVPIIMEGVHVHPELLERVPGGSDVIKVYVMLAVLKSKKIKARLKGRGVDAPQRKPRRYLNNLESIWSLQSFLLSEADRCNVPIVKSEEKEKAILQITRQVNAELRKQFKGSVREVFGTVVDKLSQEVEARPWHELVSLLRDQPSSQQDKETPVEEPVLRSKCVLLIIDGLGDLPIPELDGKTPLEAANTPILDQMAGSGLYGLVDPIIPGEIPNTHSGTGMLMGLLPEQADRLKRGPVEAAGAGQALLPGEIAVRANFATIEHKEGVFLVTDRRAGRITNDTDELASCLADVDLGDGIRGRFLSTDQHRGVLILSGPGLSDAITDSDPGDLRMPAALSICQPLKPEAELTAVKINRFILEAHRLLNDHPVNKARSHSGKLPANGIITRGAGSQIELDNMLNQHGLKTGLISGCNTVLGLGRMFGFDTIEDARFTAAMDTDLDAKITAVKEALKSHDLVFIHVKAPDICSHDRKPLAKRDFLQRIDQALKPLLKVKATIAVASDHTTNSNTGSHSADPVPALIYQSGVDKPGKPVKFGEASCSEGSMERQLSNDFLSKVLRIMSVSED